MSAATNIIQSDLMFCRGPVRALYWCPESYVGQLPGDGQVGVLI